MRYEGYSAAQRVDDILDKISRYGINSITKLEREFLDAHRIDGQEDLHARITKEESEKVFEDDFGRFKFTLDRIERGDDEVHFLGTLECPDYSAGNGKKVPGILTGKIILFENGNTSPEFSSQGLDVWDFCEGLEYELDSFVDYVVGELEREK